MRLSDPRFLSDWMHKDFRYFLETQVGDLASDQNVDKMIDLCFAKEELPGLETAFWKFKNIDVANDPELKREISRKIKQSDRSLGAIARVFLEEITRFGGYERPCVKFPVDVGHVPQLLGWFPDCKIIHITRDPRALAMSKSNDPSGTALKVQKHPQFAWLIRKAMLLFEVFQYRRTARLHTRFRHLKHYRLFRYEDLLVETEKTLKQLCEFIQMDFTKDMLEPQKGHHQHQPSSLTGKQQKAFDVRAAVRWQAVISPFDRWIVTFLTKQSMKRLNYDPKTHPIFREASRVTARTARKEAAVIS